MTQFSQSDVSGVAGLPIPRNRRYRGGFQRERVMMSLMRGDHLCVHTGDLTPYEATYFLEDGAVSWCARLSLGASRLLVSACDDAPADHPLSVEEIVGRSIGKMIESIKRRSH